jgi:hypothetical protein
MEEWVWSIIEGVCTTHGAEGTATYGVRAVCVDRVWQWPDVDVDPAVAEALVHRLNALQPDPCHFADMVLDYIEERATAEL